MKKPQAIPFDFRIDVQSMIVRDLHNVIFSKDTPDSTVLVVSSVTPYMIDWIETLPNPDTPEGRNYMLNRFYKLYSEYPECFKDSICKRTYFDQHDEQKEEWND